VLFAVFAGVRPAHLALAALVALPLVFLVPTTYRDRIATLRQGDNSISRRVASQDVAVEMFVDHPFGGIGANNYSVAYLRYGLRINEPGAAEAPHNLYLAIAAETGLLGLAAFLATLALVLRAAWRRRQAALHRGDRFAEGLATSSILALLTYLVGVAFLPIAYPRYLWMFVGLALALPAPSLVRTRRARRIGPSAAGAS
jgi:O-antigen ligase